VFSFNLITVSILKNNKYQEMENIILTKQTRKSLGKGYRFYRIIYGFIILILGIVITIRTGISLTDNQSILGIAMVLLGIASVALGLIGKGVFKQLITIQITEDKMVIKKRFEGGTTIRLNQITFMKILPLKLEFTFSNFTKTYDFSFLTDEEFNRIKTILTDYCISNKIEIE
jgi:hypothetical protein